MNFIFRFGAAGAAALCLLGCRPRQVDPPADGGDAQRLVALLDYVGGDYGLALGGAPGEYEEQLRFVAEARAMISSLLGAAGSDDDSLQARIARVETLVRARADAAAVREACRAARDEAVTRFGLRTMPTERPSSARAEVLYAESCAACHGSRGEADTPRARELTPPPASFKDPGRLRDLSPYRVYNALTFGVPGTAMASFDSLSPSDRWSLAFYVFRIGHEGEESRGPATLMLSEMAALSDREVLDALRAEGHPSPPAGLAHLRRDAAFQEPPIGAAIDRTRKLLRKARDDFASGRARDADRLVLDAYLLGFEPVEPRLRARDPQATSSAETAFHELRAALARGEAGDVQRRIEGLEIALFQLAEGRRSVVPFAAATLVYLREGLEAALLVGALLAGLRKLGRAEAARFVHAGWIAALPAGLLTWWASARLISMGAADRELVEAVVGLTAAAVLFAVSFWLISRADAQRWRDYLRKHMQQSVGRRRLLLLSGLAFLAVYREAAETVLFTQALLLESPAQRAQVWAGAVAGLAAVVVVATMMSRSARRLPIASFFALSGALLCALAISFAGSGIYDLVTAGYLPPWPVPFPEVSWLGIHPDLTALLVQLTIVSIVAGAAVTSLRRRTADLSRND